MMSMNPKNGHVMKAWVGGINYRHYGMISGGNKDKLDSTFKPFLYTTAIDQLKLSPCDMLPV